MDLKRTEEMIQGLGDEIKMIVLAKQEPTEAQIDMMVLAGIALVGGIILDIKRIADALERANP